MKILIATPMTPPDIGGPGTHAMMVAAAFPQCGIDCRLVSFSDVRHLPKGLSHLVYFWRVIKAALGVDVIYVLESVSTGYPALWAAKLLRKKLILRTAGFHAWEQGVQRKGLTQNLDEFITAWTQKPEQFPRKVRRWMRMQMKVVKHAHKVVVPSQYFKKLYHQLEVPDDKVEVVYSSFTAQHDESVFTRERDHNLIVSVGRLVPWKGMVMLVEAFAELHYQQPDTRLVIIGEGDEEQKIREKIGALQLESFVTVTGALPHKEVDEYLLRAGLFVLNTGYEGLSHTLLEAMDAGTPVITTPVGGNSEVVTSRAQGLLVPYNDQKQLTHAMKWLLQDRAFALVLAKAAKQSLERFSRDRAVGRLLDVFRRQTVLYITTDETALIAGSKRAQELQTLAAMSEWLQVLVLTRQSLREVKLGNTVTVTPIEGASGWLQMAKAIKIAQSLPKPARIIVEPGGVALRLAKRLTRYFGASLIVHVLSDVLGDDYARQSLRTRFCVWQERTRVRVADQVWLRARGLKHEYGRLFPKQSMYVLHPSVPVKEYAQEIESMTLHQEFKHFSVIVFVYSDGREPAEIYTALRAFQYFLTMVPTAGLVLAGFHDVQRRYEFFARGIGVGERVEFVGPQNEPLHYFRGATIFLDTRRYWRSGIQVETAMALAIPTVASAVGDVGTVYEDGKHLLVCSPGDDQCFGAALGRLGTDKVFFEKLSTAARERVQEVYQSDGRDHNQVMKEALETY